MAGRAIVPPTVRPPAETRYVRGGEPKRLDGLLALVLARYGLALGPEQQKKADGKAA